MSQDYVLNINNLSFSYTKQQSIYKNFNLKVKIGELVCIVGSSGSGKSTLFELISKNLKASSGTIVSSSLSLIFQDPYSSFHPSYSILNQIKDVVDYENNSFKKDIKNYCKELNLDINLLDKKVFELSGGEIQRCSILRALLMKPKLLLVDEPTSSLDNIIAYEVMTLLIKCLDKCAIILITHDMDLAKWSSNNIINLEGINE